VLVITHLLFAKDTVGSFKIYQRQVLDKPAVGFVVRVAGLGS